MFEPTVAAVVGHAPSGRTETKGSSPYAEASLVLLDRLDVVPLPADRANLGG